MKQIEYKKQFSRDYTLAFCEVWCRAESILPKKWTKLKQPKYPYIVFERNKNGVDCYMDEDGIKFLKEELFKKYLNDKGFCQKIADNFLKTENHVNNIRKSKKILNRKELKSLLKSLQIFWIWFEAIWWLISTLEDNGFERTRDIRIVQNARKKGERTTGGNIDDLINRSIRSVYPKYAEYSKVISSLEILSNKISRQDILKKRMIKYYCTSREIFYSQKSLSDKFSIKLATDSKVNTKEIKGTIAYKGVVRGIVRKIYKVEQIKDFKKGEILVSPMTLPIFIKAIKDASAIVTDEGGIICHAAIVARELKKPCIIGTKIATKVLKDGDLVEVGAEKGVVKVIKRF